MELAEFEIYRQNPRERAGAFSGLSWLVFAGAVALLLLGVPFEMQQAARNAATQAEGGDKAPFSMGASYLLLFLFAVLNPSAVLKNIWRLASEQLSFVILLLALAMMLVAAFFTTTESRTFLLLGVDILKYLAFVSLFPLILQQVQPLLRPGYVTAFLFITATAIMYMLLREGGTRSIGGPSGENVRLGFGSVATASGSHLAAVIAAIALCAAGLRNIRTWHLAVLGLSFFMLTIGVGLTGSRASMVFVIGGVLLYLFIRSFNNPILMITLFSIVTAAAFALLLGYETIVQQLPDAWQERIERREGADLTTGRIDIWNAYLHYFRTHQLAIFFGIKEGTFVYRVAIPHNWFLGILARHGLFVMILLLCYYWRVAVAAWRLVRQSDSRIPAIVFSVLVMGLVHGMVDNALFTNGSVLSFIWYSCTGWVCYHAMGYSNGGRRALLTFEDHPEPGAIEGEFI